MVSSEMNVMKKLHKKRKIIIISVVCVVLLAIAATIIFGILSKDNIGWQTNGKNKYYITNNEQERAKGFFKIGENKYYFGTDGYLVTGWFEIGGKKYYSLPDGTVVSGLNTINNTSYVFRFDDNSLIYGWSKVYGERYYSDEAGVVQTGFVDLEDCRYYFDDKGRLATGSFTVNEKSYFANEDGKMLSGYFKINENIYLFSDENFTAKSGWQDTIDGRLYFDTKGIASNGIIELDGDNYLFSNGTYLTGWQKFNGNQYYFYNDGKMAKGTEIDIYTIGTDGIAIMEECNKNNLNEYLDFYLDKYGRTPQNIYDAVHDNMTYKYDDKGASYEEMTCYAINNGKGACYHYAAFGYMLFKRAGYEVYVVEGINGRTGNNHMWLYVKMEDGWFYVDPVYNAGAKMTEEYLINNGSSWDKSSLPTD